jgi:hypothetical protein
MPDERSRWQAFWRKGAPGLIIALLALQKLNGAWTSLWFRGGMAIALSWLGIAAISGLAIESRLALTCSVLVAIASLVMWLGGSASFPGFVAFVAVLLWAWRFAPPRKSKRAI